MTAGGDTGSSSTRWFHGTPYAFGDPAQLKSELIGAGLEAPQEEIEAACLAALELEDADISRVALTALGHSARTNTAISSQAYEAVLQALANRELQGRAIHALRDIAVFVHGVRRWQDIPGLTETPEYRRLGRISEGEGEGGEFGA